MKNVRLISLGFKSIGVACLLLCSFVLIQSGCSRAKTQRECILHVTLPLGNPFYREMADGIQEALGTNSQLQLVTRSIEQADNVTAQREILESYLQGHISKSGPVVRGVILVPAKTGLELTTVIRQFNDAGIPIINIDIPIEQQALNQSGATVSAVIASDNHSGGKKAGEYMATLVPEGGQILLLAGASGNSNGKARRDGFIEGLSEMGKQKGVKYEVKEWAANWSRTEAVTATDSALAANPSLKGIFAANDEMALGAAQALDTASLGTHPRPHIVGYDALPETKIAIQKGRIDASISQNPGAMGKNAVEYIRAINNGQKVETPKIVDVSVVHK